MNELLKMFLGPIGDMPGTDGEGGGPRERKPVESKPPKGTPVTRILISLLATVVFAGIYFYFELPALNIHNGGLWWFLVLLCLVFSICMLLLGGFRSNSPKEYLHYSRTKLAVPFWIIAAIAVIVVVGTVIGWAVFRAKDYSELISVDEGDFASEVSEISWNQIPTLDEDSSNNLANRKLGELSDLVSQFTVSTSSTQINYQGNPVRVNYLNYGGFFKWWNNYSSGIPAYMCIDMRSQEVTVIRMEKGIKYSPSEYLNRDLNRHLRFNYPRLLFGDVNFEIDEEGTPYWVASVVDKTIGLFSGDDIIGAVLCNAITGECRYYEVGDIPSWVDRVYSASLLVGQYNYYGKYHNGFWNSLFGQNDCTTATQGYNYIAQDDDVWMYTGITSVTGDRGNIGFILVNQRTKEARYYACAGAEEYSAMSSAEGAVQQYSYTATFPLLLNISDQPTYFMALKDSGGLVKMYAMVNVQQYQLVATGSSLSDCQTNYHNLLLSGSIVTEEALEEDTDAPALETETVAGKIEDIRQANMDGNTIFYLRLEDSEVYYTVSAKDYPITAILNVGDAVTITYFPREGVLVQAETLEVS